MSVEQKLLEKFEQRANQRIFMVNLVSLLVGFVSLLSLMSVIKAAISISIGILILLVPFYLDRKGYYQKLTKYAYIMVIVFFVGAFFIILGEGNQDVPLVYFVTIILAAFYNSKQMLYVTAGTIIVQNIGLYLLFPESFYYNYDNTTLINLLLIFLLATYVVATLLKENKRLADEVVKNESYVGNMLGMMQKVIGDVKGFTRQLNQCSDLLDSSSGDVGSSSQEISTSLEQMSVSIEEQVTHILTISKNSEEINETIHSIFTRTQETTLASKDSLARSKESGQALKNIRENIEHIGGTINDAVMTIQELGENSQEIGNIVDVIKNVTKQTNLLALNASIEAARAGEHGKGFAVVAEEIKNLADQSVQATENISTIIQFIREKIVEATSNIVQGEGEVKEAISQIGLVTNEYDSVLDTLTNVVDEIGDVATNLEGIAAHNDQVTRLVENLSFSSEENSASIEEVSASMEEQTAMTYTLQEISGNLKEIVAKLSLLMDEVKTVE